MTVQVAVEDDIHSGRSWDLLPRKSMGIEQLSIQNRTHMQQRRLRLSYPCWQEHRPASLLGFPAIRSTQLKQSYKLLMSNDNVPSVEDDAEHVENTGPNIRNYYKVDGSGAQSIRVGAKNIRCIFCDTFQTGVELFLRKRRQILNLVFEYVKMMIINM